MTMSGTTPPLPSEEARQALESVDTMQRAGWRRAAPPRWFSIFNACFIAFIVGAFALPEHSVHVFGNLPIATRDIIIFVGGMAYAAVIWRHRTTCEACIREFTAYKGAWLPLASFLLGFTVLVCASFVFNHFFNLAWVSVLAALAAGAWTFAIFEWERKRILELSTTKHVGASS